MNTSLIPQNLQNLQNAVTLVNGVPTTNSLLVAQEYGKEHRNVISAIEYTIEQAVDYLFVTENIWETNIPDSQGKNRKAYEMTEEGFLIVAAGFTGEKALNLRVSFAKLFKKIRADIMEAKEKRMRERLITLAEIADENAQLRYEAGVHESKCKALAIADKSAYDMIEKATRNHHFEVTKLNLKIDQLTGEVMRLKAEGADRKARDTQQREEISKQRAEIRGLKDEIRELKAEIGRLRQGGAHRRNRK